MNSVIEVIECICNDVFDKFYLNSASRNFISHDPDQGLGLNVNQLFAPCSWLKNMIVVFSMS